MLSKGVFSVSQSAANADLIIVKKNNQVIGTRQIRISGVRAYIVGDRTSQYTLNAALRIAQFVSDQLDLNYKVPTNLLGTWKDDALIIPDNIALGIVLLQAYKGVAVDGLPGADFIKRVMGLHQTVILGAQRRAAFMDESDNKTAVLPNGKRIVMPDFRGDESTVYDFLRDITLVRNGLWSDIANIVNITGLRQEKGNTGIIWNDTISIWWLDANGRKHAKLYTATTEPGNRNLNKTLMPQTILFVPGYHQGKLPAMRGHRTMTFVPTAKQSERLLFNTNDERGLNLHPGGNAGSLRNLVRYILPTGAATESEFKAVLVFMELYEIVSRWGLDPNRPAWEHLSNWAAKKALNAGPAIDGIIAVYQDGKTQAVRKISTAAARGWLAKKWSSKRQILLQILRSAEPEFTEPVNFKTLRIRDLENVITERHIEGIVQRQCDFFFDVRQVDGLAGNTYLSLLNANIPADGALAQLANADYARMKELFNKFGGSSGVLTTKRKNYVQQIISQTLAERKKIAESESNALMEDTVPIITDKVGTWSILCQVVFGPVIFYEMMRLAVGNSLQTGQRRWYYTLVNVASIPKS